MSDLELREIEHIGMDEQLEQKMNNGDTVETLLIQGIHSAESELEHGYTKWASNILSTKIEKAINKCRVVQENIDKDVNQIDALLNEKLKPVFEQLGIIKVSDDVDEDDVQEVIDTVKHIVNSYSKKYDQVCEIDFTQFSAESVSER